LRFVSFTGSPNPTFQRSRPKLSLHGEQEDLGLTELRELKLFSKMAAAGNYNKDSVNIVLKWREPGREFDHRYVENNQQL